MTLFNIVDSQNSKSCSTYWLRMIKVHWFFLISAETSIHLITIKKFTITWWTPFSTNKKNRVLRMMKTLLKILICIARSHWDITDLNKLMKMRVPIWTCIKPTRAICKGQPQRITFCKIKLHQNVNIWRLLFLRVAIRIWLLNM